MEAAKDTERSLGLGSLDASQASPFKLLILYFPLGKERVGTWQYLSGCVGADKLSLET